MGVFHLSPAGSLMSCTSFEQSSEFLKVNKLLYHGPGNAGDDIIMLSGEYIYGYPGDIFLWYAWVKIINKEQGSSLLDTIK